MKTVIITGASSGLGKCIYNAMYTQIDDTRSDFIFHCHNWSTPHIDIRNPYEVEHHAAKFPKVDILINCAGVNAIEYLPNLEEEIWDRVMDTNAKGIYLVTKALLPALRGGTVLNIVSNASHIPMTCSLAYNASKGAAAIMTKQMARELKKTHDITVFSISPNKLKGTGMSEYIDEKVCQLRGWTKEQAQAYQLAALPAGEETDPEQLAEFITFLLSTKERHKYLNGCDIPYGA